MNWQKVAFALVEESKSILSEAFDDPKKRSIEGVTSALTASHVLDSLAKAIAFGAKDEGGG
jgi:hypothetical protein